ncbi:MAG: GNAT family N-acetyltransferase [Clostridia bacterium]|nr:GNAT family N-acetyltransferase [Clostridia bacterium]
MIELLARRDFDEVFALMEASFPQNEYRPYYEQKALLDDPAYSIYTFSDMGDGAVRAFIAVWKFDDLAFIEHFAVNPRYRNGGIGAQMLREVVDSLKTMVCLEVEPPHDEFSARRIAFYERNGFRLNEYPYIQPPIAQRREAVSLLIMTWGESVSEEVFERIKATLYSNVYKLR